MKHKANATALWSIGTAVPEQRVSQEEALRFMLTYHQADARLARQLSFIYRRSHIDFRHSCSKGAQLISESGEASTGQRMLAYEAEVVDLAERAAQDALDQQRHVTAADITHLIMVTCTGFFSPGPDLLLIDRLGLRPNVRRLQIGFMGCHAALQGLQTADSICRGDANAVVLLVCAELCSLHHKHALTEENLIINSLFADGAAATVLSRAEWHASSPLCQIRHFASHVYPEVRDSISWRIEDDGFRMGLALSNAKDLRRLLPAFMDSFLKEHGYCQSDIDCWAIHPGGRAVLDACERALNLEPDALAASRAILRNYGNMSSPTVLFVMQHLLSESTGQAGHGLTLAFGPGVAFEGMLWSHGND